MKTPPISIGAFDAKTHLSQYLDQVEKGSCIEITRRGKPVAMLIPADKSAVGEEEIDLVVNRVRERSASYGITREELLAWKKEGQR